MDSKHQSISHTISASIMEAINTITELCANSLRVGQLVLWTSSLYDSLQYSTKAILVDFFNFPYLRTTTRLQLMLKSNWKLCHVTARKAGIEPTLTVLETALLPLEDFRKIARGSTPRAFFPFGVPANFNLWGNSEA